MKTIALYFFLVLASYLVVGNLMHRVLFPERKPDISTWFKPGQQLYSKAEGFRQTVVKQENGHVYCMLEMEPFAAGPPKHIHTDFDETFQIENGELTVWVDGKIHKIHPGETLHIPQGTPHKPYNETGDTIRSKGIFPFPEKFAFHLAQVYGLMDEQPGFVESSDIAVRMALFQNNGFDSYIVDGPPVVIQKATGFLLAPALRVFGYKSYYEKHDPFRNNH